jgi:hypothetical protein
MGQSNDIQEKFLEVLKMCHDYSTWHSGVRTDPRRQSSGGPFAPLLRLWTDEGTINYDTNPTLGE